MPKKSKPVGETLTFERVPSMAEGGIPEGGIPEGGIPDGGIPDDSIDGGSSITSQELEFPRELEGLFNAFKLCGPRKLAPPPSSDTQSNQGATFYAIVPTSAPRDESVFKGQDFCFVSAYMIQPLCPGRATAPYEYGRGSKKSKEALQAHNKSGAPLTAWADAGQTNMRFWGCEKKGFNRGNRVENATWTYSGGE